MKKLNLLSKAEMKHVIGGNVPVEHIGACASECSKDGDTCSSGGRCTFYAASPECPNGEFACIV